MHYTVARRCAFVINRYHIFRARSYALLAMINWSESPQYNFKVWNHSPNNSFRILAIGCPLRPNPTKSAQVLHLPASWILVDRAPRFLRESICVCASTTTWCPQVNAENWEPENSTQAFLFIFAILQIVSTRFFEFSFLTLNIPADKLLLLPAV